MSRTATYCDPASGYRLGQWVGNQRRTKDTLSPERRARLDALGFVWDVLDAQWEEGVGYFERYRKAKGDGLVPFRYRDPASGYQLGQWVDHQRNGKDTLSPERRARLDALGFVWDVLGAQWEEGVSYFERYRQAHGDGLVPARYRDPASGYPLGLWVRTQRRTKDTLSPERRARLDALGFVWDVLGAQWEEGFRSFERYRQAHGDGLVPFRYRDPASGYRLGQWVSINARTKTLCHLNGVRGSMRWASCGMF